EQRGTRPPPEGAPATGNAIGRYAILGTLADGALLLAFDTLLDRKVTIKIVDAPREAKAMARLSHANILGVYETFTLDGVTFMVMEPVGGGTLRDWLAETPRTITEISDVFHAIGAGLGTAHRARVVHGDFGPAHVFIDENGRPQVANFALTDGPSDPKLDQRAFCAAFWEALEG